MIVAHAYAAKRRYFDGDSLYLHRPQDGTVSGRELPLRRAPGQQIHRRARPSCWISAWCSTPSTAAATTPPSPAACISSSGTDFYSSIAAAVGSLKGPRHGGANITRHGRCSARGGRECRATGRTTRRSRAYLNRIIHKEAGRRQRPDLRHGPRHLHHERPPGRHSASKFARNLAEEKGMTGPAGAGGVGGAPRPRACSHRETGHDKMLCANVDLYSGFVYQMLDIPEELYTPLFAIARMVGWCAHRLEEVYTPRQQDHPPRLQGRRPQAPLRAAVAAGLSKKFSTDQIPPLWKFHIPWRGFGFEGFRVECGAGVRRSSR